jgi:hypothetical protein
MPPLKRGWEALQRAASPLGPNEFFRFLELARISSCDFPCDDLCAMLASQLNTEFQRSSPYLLTADVVEIIWQQIQLTNASLLKPTTVPRSFTLVVPSVHHCLGCGGELTTHQGTRQSDSTPLQLASRGQPTANDGGED